MYDVGEIWSLSAWFMIILVLGRGLYDVRVSTQVTPEIVFSWMFIAGFPLNKQEHWHRQGISVSSSHDSYSPLLNMFGMLSNPVHLAHGQQGKELPRAFTEGAMV